MEWTLQYCIPNHTALAQRELELPTLGDAAVKLGAVGQPASVVAGDL